MYNLTNTIQVHGYRIATSLAIKVSNATADFLFISVVLPTYNSEVHSAYLGWLV